MLYDERMNTFYMKISIFFTIIIIYNTTDMSQTELNSQERIDVWNHQQRITPKTKLKSWYYWA